MYTAPDQLGPPADMRSAVLSGGQEKRVSIALELLTKPSVLFLDEPTSSLDVELKEDVVDSMRELAKTGRTVIMVTHDLEYLDKCDRVLVLMPGGRMAFYGPSDEGLRYFGKMRWAEVHRAFRQQPERDWAGRVQAIVLLPELRRHGTDRPDAGVRPPRPRAALGTAKPTRPADHPVPALRHAHRRRPFLPLLLLAVPIVLGFLIRASAGGPGLRGPGAETTLLLLVIIAAFTGGFTSVQELIKEREMCRRERTAGLSAGAYLLQGHGARAHHRRPGRIAGRNRRSWRADAGSWRVAEVVAVGRADGGRGRPRRGLDGLGPGRVGVRPFAESDRDRADPHLASPGRPDGRTDHAQRVAEADLVRGSRPVGLRRGRFHHRPQRHPAARQ